MPGILIIAPNWIGDAVMTQPLLASIKALYPDSKPISRRTEQGPETSKQLRTLLEQELAQGFSVESGHVSEGLNTIAAAATNHLRIPTAAFAVTFRTEDANEATTFQLAKLVITASQELSKRLGASGR